MSNKYENFGNKIRQKRLSLGLTQQKFADELGVSRVYISDIENGKKLPTGYCLTKLQQTLNISIDYLFNDTESKYIMFSAENLNEDDVQMIYDFIAFLEKKNNSSVNPPVFKEVE